MGEPETAAQELDASAVARLQKNARGRAFWHARAPGYRRLAAPWVVSAKQEATRARRLEVLIACCNEEQVIPSHRWGPKNRGS